MHVISRFGQLAAIIPFVVTALEHGADLNIPNEVNYCGVGIHQLAELSSWIVVYRVLVVKS